MPKFYVNVTREATRTAFMVVEADDLDHAQKIAFSTVGEDDFTDDDGQADADHQYISDSGPYVGDDTLDSHTSDAPPHPRHGVGYCGICHHYGDDCTGTLDSAGYPDAPFDPEVGVHTVVGGDGR